MSATVYTIDAAATASVVRPGAASSRRASTVRATATASKSASAPAVLGGVTLHARVHRPRGAVVMRAEGEGLQRDNPELEERFATVG